MSSDALILLRVMLSGTKDVAPVENNCRACQHRYSIPGSCHIACDKPDPAMTGHQHGIENGWFMYPLNYDPVWMTAKCGNFTEKIGFASPWVD